MKKEEETEKKLEKTTTKKSNLVFNYFKERNLSNKNFINVKVK